ncbi:hypothetical protein TVAG_295000 [Trichomonas vaginalis G3]|uniref:PAS domain-containing protein n=1 Tax=Trichomonas vaginalis (strain ATCC PRA-98 / G3) TaxID=412133 RepID=A2DL57_TRIV3|nr:guanylate cyclase protein [Trichomonas vaginalis G3]EAY18848.1 hypothetical protein TVAG_295000 [Trichomonas vaginalis G3]KAI5526046.1 guanylate cyclase protein [Trichomonas vaginalis G3]|eukprot:XP_001579834.1 hypothetical protein [Trichomonas vaginalis G3]
MRSTQAQQEFTEAHQQASIGYYGSGDILEEINRIREDSPCNFSLKDATYHESYSCLSLDSGVSAFYNMITDIQVQYQSTTMLSDTAFINTFHFLNAHLYPQMEEVIDLLLDQADKTDEQQDMFVTVLASSGTFLTFITLFFAIYRYWFMRMTYKTMIEFILRVPPVDAVNNDDLMMILLNRKISQKLAKMSETATLLANTSHPLIFTTSDGVIVNVNSSFQIVFTYEISHIIGQNIAMITDVDKLQNVFHYNEMKSKLNHGGNGKSNRQSLVTKNDENAHNSQTIVFDNISAKFRKENGQEIECDVLPILTNSQHSKNSLFAFVLTDFSTVLAKQKKIGILKGGNDNLQNNLRPPILNNENHSLTLNDCSICTMRLVQFSNSLAPTAVMKQRKQILDKIDENLKKYETLQRLFFAQGMYCIISSNKNAPMDIFRYIDDVLSSFDDPTFFGEITIGVDTNQSINICETKGDVKEIACVGELFDKASRLSMIGESGMACITENVYNQVASIGAKFVSKKDPIIGSYYSVEPIER